MRIVGNLDVESTWARLDAAARRARGEFSPRDEARFALADPVLEKISALATLLRVFARDDTDEIWTPRPVDPQRMAPVAWLPAPRLASGPLPDSADLWWGEPSVVAAAVNHRSFVQDVRAAAGCMVPGAAIVQSIEELRSHIARAGAAWVAKAPHSAAGRSRVRGENGLLTEPASRQAAKLLESFGCLLFEPWLERRGDFGVVGEVDASGHAAIESPHRLLVDSTGRFEGIKVPAPERNDLLGGASDIAHRTAKELAARGYRGPFGIDLFLVAADGRSDPELHLSEINARLTFGHVAHAITKAARMALRFDPGLPLALRTGRDLPPAGSVPLLMPDEGDASSAWLVIQ